MQQLFTVRRVICVSPIVARVLMTALQYAAPDVPRPPGRRWPARVLGAGALFAIASVLVPTNVTVRQVESSMDAVTGSMTWKTTWIFGIRSVPRVDVSPLERRLVRMGAQWTPAPTGVHIKYLGLFGTPLGYACGTAPKIYDLGSLQQDFVASSTDEEILAFVHMMEAGNEAEQRAAVEAAGEKALEKLATRYRVAHD
jgi:hypothetical protein